MRRNIAKALIVTAMFVGLIAAAQRLLVREKLPPARLLVELIGSGAAEGERAMSEFRLTEGGRLLLDGKTAGLDDLFERLESSDGPQRIVVSAEGLEGPLTFQRDEQGRVTRDGRPSSMLGLRAELMRLASAENVEPTRPVTVQDVLKAGIPPGTIEKVSLPGFPYKKAYPEAADEPEVTITQYRGHPMFDDPTLMPEKLKPYYPATFPPVEDRLPLNPAVVRGPDGIGRYSQDGKVMVWRRCSSDDWRSISRKIGYPSLVRFDAAGRLQPNLAWKWEVSPDNRVFTFHLRQGMKWSDGQPYTTEDILFVTETVTGSEAATMPPDWMQETNGLNMIYPEDVLDWRGLAETIVRQGQSPDPSPGRQIWHVIDQDRTDRLKPLREMLVAVSRGTLPDEATAPEITAKLNSLLMDRTFYDSAAWQDVDLASDLETLERKGYSRLSREERELYENLLRRADFLARAKDIADEDKWRSGEVTQFNVLLFRAAYRQFVSPPRRERVKVEAIPDENGDSRYILRFTFPKPNSIFLELNATFILYVGVFDVAKHFHSRYHPEGMRELDIFDVLRWQDFLEQLRRRGTEPGSSPERRVWSLLSEEIKRKLSERPPAEARHEDEQYKAEIVAELNRICARRDFYDPESWAGVDLTSELKLLMDKGYSGLVGRDRGRVRQLMRRRHLLERGVADLSDEEVFDLNVALLRAAFDGDPKLDEEARDRQKLLAVNRSDALDKEAQSRGFRTSSIQWQELRKYHKDWSPDRPTVCPWRVVSEAEDMTVRAVRNPYYFKVDAAGNQLPYIDMIESERVTRKEHRLLKLRQGVANFQSRDLEFEDFTPLKQNEKAGDYEVRLWANDYCGEVTYIFCQQHNDAEYRKLMADWRFRQAMSLALNRQEIIDVVFKGMAQPAQFSVPQGSKYYNPRLHKAFIDYDPGRANSLLDDMGLDKRNAEGVRLLWSGRPLIIELSFEEERPLAAVQLAANYWRDVGVKTLIKQRSGLVKWRLYDMGKYDVWVHKEGGNYFGPLDAGCMVPTHPAESVQYSRWTVWLKSGGREGEEPPEHVKRLERMWREVTTSPTEDAKVEAWLRLTDRVAGELPTLALCTSPGKVVYVKNNFKNVPKLALAGWIAHEPGNCNPEVFYVEEDE